MSSSVSKKQRSEALAERGSRAARSSPTQGMEAIRETATQLFEAASDASDSIIAYTKKNPAIALGIAAAAGALLVTLVNAIGSTRDS